MRYTEVRMKKIAGEILADLDKETVTFVPNFDESTVEPVILPSKIPEFIGEWYMLVLQLVWQLLFLHII